MILLVFDPNTGEITQEVHGAMGEVATDQYRSLGLEAKLINGFAANYWMKNGELTTRPEIKATLSKSEILSDGKDCAVLSGLPIGVACRVRVTHLYGQEEFALDEIEGGQVLITANMPGRYRTEINAFPYRPFVCDVEAK